MKKIREGYKMTELGEIPNEWCVDSMEKIIVSTQLGTNTLGKEIAKIPMLKMGNLTIGGFNLNKLEYISEEELEENKDYVLKKGDFLFNTRNTLELVGKSAVWNEQIETAIFNSNIMRIKYCDRIDNFYMGYYFSSNIGWKELKSISTGTTSVAAIYTKDLMKVKVVIPSVKEQEKIASILSTVDEQIDNVDELIQKNKELKKGLMKQLLAKGIGHTKFKKTEIGDIPEEWEVKSIDEITKEVYRYPTYYGIEYVDKGIAEIRGELLNDDASIKKDSFRYISETTAKKFPRTKLEFGDIVISVRGTIGKVGYITEELAGSNITANLLRVSMNRNIMIEDFVKQLFLSDIMKKNFEKITTSTTIKTFKVPEFKQIILAIPQKDEQIKIASILSKLDEKIEEYENKKDKLEQLKRGLMQQMLTGKIRVN